MKLRWRKDPKETGLRAVMQGPRGSGLYGDCTVKFASVAASVDRFGTWKCLGWYWVAGWGSSVPHKNTCNELVPTEEQAKADALTYVKAHLAGKPNEVTA